MKKAPPIWLKEVPAQLHGPDPELVSVLKSVEDVISGGHVIGLAGVVLYRDGSTGHFRGGQQDCTLIGRMEILRSKIIGDCET